MILTGLSYYISRSHSWTNSLKRNPFIETRPGSFNNEGVIE
jgi:hypothetical protein